MTENGSTISIRAHVLRVSTSRTTGTSKIQYEYDYEFVLVEHIDVIMIFLTVSSGRLNLFEFEFWLPLEYGKTSPQRSLVLHQTK